MMEEVGSHEGDDDHVCAAAEAAHGDAVISDALQDAAQTNVPDSECYIDVLVYVQATCNLAALLIVI